VKHQRLVLFVLLLVLVLGLGVVAGMAIKYPPSPVLVVRAFREISDAFVLCEDR
jgi:hypothetical protein